MFKSIPHGRFEQASLLHGTDSVHLLITKDQMVDFTYTLFVGCTYNCDDLEHLHFRFHYQKEMQGKCMVRPSVGSPPLPPPPDPEAQAVSPGLQMHFAEGATPQ